MFCGPDYIFDEDLIKHLFIQKYYRKLKFYLKDMRWFCSRLADSITKKVYGDRSNNGT